MPAPAPTPEERKQMNERIQSAKEQVKSILRPFDDKLRHQIFSAVITDLHIEI